MDAPAVSSLLPTLFAPVAYFTHFYSLVGSKGSHCVNKKREMIIIVYDIHDSWGWTCHLSPLYSYMAISSSQPWSFYSTFIFLLYVRLQAHSLYQPVFIFSSFFFAFLLLSLDGTLWPLLFFFVNPSMAQYHKISLSLSAPSSFSPVSNGLLLSTLLCVNLDSVCVLVKQIVHVQTHFNSLNVRTSDKCFS